MATSKKRKKKTVKRKPGRKKLGGAKRNADTHGSARAQHAEPGMLCVFNAKLKALSMPTQEICRLAFSVDETELTVERALHFLNDSCLEVELTVDAAGEGDVDGQQALLETDSTVKLMATAKSFTFGSKPGTIVSAFFFARETQDMNELAALIKRKAKVSVCYVSDASE